MERLFDSSCGIKNPSSKFRIIFESFNAPAEYMNKKVKRRRRSVILNLDRFAKQS
jgi:hypothetical protein